MTADDAKAAPANGRIPLLRSRRDLLVMVGLVALCLAADLVAFHSVQSYAVASGSSLTGLFLAIFVPLTVLTPTLYYLVFVRRVRQETAFLVAATVIGLVLMLVRTPYAWFDENDHVYLALYYSDVALGAEHGVTEDGRLTWVARAEDAGRGDAATGTQTFSHHETTADDYRLMAEHFFELERRPGATTTLAVDDVGVFYQYIPPALGVTVAHLLHLGNVPTLYLGKLFSLAFYVLMMYLAIRTAPKRFKALFTLLGLIPFVLSSAGTFSYDNMINVLSFLFIALVLRLAYDALCVRARDIAVLALLAMLLAPLKYVYLPLVLLPVIIPKEKWPQPRLRALCCAGFLLLGLAAIGLFSMSQAFVEVARATADKSLSASYPDAYTLKTFFAQPMTALKVFGFSLLQRLGLLIDIPSGFTFSSRLPLWASYLMFVLLLLNSSGPSDAAKDGPPFRMRRSTRLVLLALALVVYSLVLLAAVSWTPVGSPILAGVQGRYFIPLLPLLALAASGFIRPGKDIGRASLYLFCCLGGLEAFFTFVSVV
jgi:uncharacterized membrane protein